MKGIKYICCISLFTFLLSLKLVESKGKNHKLEYMIQIHEKWIDTVKLESPRFGLKYKRTLVSNILLFEGWLSPSDGVAVDVKAFKGFFADKIKYIQKREKGIVRYYTRENDTSEAIEKTLGSWILRQRKHLHSSSNQCWPYYGMAVQEAWSLGYTGLGVNVAVVDIGVEVDHPDLKHNIAKNLSYSFVDTNHSHVYPTRFKDYIETEMATSHGTMAAGLIAGMFGNNLCSSGVAFKSKVAALKVFRPVENPQTWMMLGFELSAKHIPAALAYKRDNIDIYSCSFNLAHKFQLPSPGMNAALIDGVTKGRKGKGNIFVISAGNIIGQIYDCTMEALANSIFTITVSSVGKNGCRPSYAIPCAATLASTYGEFKTLRGVGKLTTTTHDGKCGQFKGTSASTALASGIFALTLQANPNITWRDLQHIIVLTATHERLENTGQLKINAAGLHYDCFFGFGLMDVAAMVKMAAKWRMVPPQKQKMIHGSQERLRFSKENILLTSIHVDACVKDEDKDCVRFVEHVQIELRYTKRQEALLDIILCSPQGTCSCLLSRKPTVHKANNQHGWRNWNFTSVHFWGENPIGSWTLLFNRSNALFQQHFEVKTISLILFGTSSIPSESLYNKSENETYKRTNGATHNLNSLIIKHENDNFVNDMEKDAVTKNQESINFLDLLVVVIIVVVVTICMLILIVLCVYNRWSRAYFYRY